jgi:tetratricopeptide (TPR) repeat protein
MKSIALAASLVFLFVFGGPVSAQNNAQAVYNQGVLLFNQNQFEEALARFEQVLQVRPDFVYARNYAAKCKAALAKGAGPKNDLEGKLARLVLPEVNFAEAPLGDVMDYFSSRAQEISGGQVVVNFLYKGSSEDRAKTLITLSLRNVPMNEAIKYVGQLSRCRIRYEPHAVIIDPSPAPEPAPAPAASTTGNPPFGSPAPTAQPKNPFE